MEVTRQLANFEKKETESVQEEVFRYLQGLKEEKERVDRQGESEIKEEDSEIKEEGSDRGEEST